jgi:hypothetical protein
MSSSGNDIASYLFTEKESNVDRCDERETIKSHFRECLPVKMDSVLSFLKNRRE